MRVLLINPFTVDEKGSESRNFLSPVFFPNLGLAYLAAMLERQDHLIKILDYQLFPFSEENLKKEIKAFQPDIAGITIITIKILAVKKISALLKKNNKEIQLVGGGPHISLDPYGIFREISQLDFTVEGEGEFALLELLETLENKRDISKVKGIYYRDGQTIRKTEKRPRIKNLDELPLPALHHYPRIIKTKDRLRKTTKLFLLTSRGCPHKCIFCQKVFGSSYVSNSPEYIVDEIRYFTRTFGSKEIHFVDQIFLNGREKVLEFCSLLLRHKLDISWSCNGRIDFLYKNQELIPLIKKAGCWYISFGIESGNQLILDLIKKNISLEQTVKVTDLLSENGIIQKGYFMLGHVHDNKKTINETIAFARRLKLDLAGFSQNIPFPGTKQYMLAVQDGSYNLEPYEKMTHHNKLACYAPRGLSKEYIKKMQNYGYRAFYLRPEYFIRQLWKMRDYSLSKRYFKSGLEFFKK